MGDLCLGAAGTFFAKTIWAERLSYSFYFSILFLDDLDKFTADFLGLAIALLSFETGFFEDDLVVLTEMLLLMNSLSSYFFACKSTFYSTLAFLLFTLSFPFVWRLTVF